MYMYIVGREREEEAGLQSLHRDSAATRAGSACKMGVWSVAVAMALSGASPVESCIAMSKASPGPAFAEQALLARGLLGHERLAEGRCASWRLVRLFEDSLLLASRFLAFSIPDG